VFPVRYGLNFYINLLRNSVFKELILVSISCVDGYVYRHNLIHNRMQAIKVLLLRARIMRALRTYLARCYGVSA
jgi:hypothetical protein